MTAPDLETWLPYVDAYAEGTLDPKDALRLRLAAGQSPELTAAVESARAFHAALASMPVSTPSEAFEARILGSVPLARYASAPRRSAAGMVLGEWTPSVVQRLVLALGKGLSAVAAAWLVTLAVGSTAWQAQISAAAVRLGEQLDLWAQAAASTPVVGQLARALATAYDAGQGALGSVAGTVGAGLTIFVVGSLAGAFTLWVAMRTRGIARDRVTHRG